MLVIDVEKAKLIAFAVAIVLIIVTYVRWLIRK